MRCTGNFELSMLAQTLSSSIDSAVTFRAASLVGGATREIYCRTADYRKPGKFLPNIHEL